MIGITFSLVNFEALKLGPTVTALGFLGKEAKVEAFGKLGIPWQDINETPLLISLLSWHCRISEFAGRQDEMAELERWANAAPGISVRFVTGEGGVGKSRLAAEFCQHMQEQKWSAGFVDLKKSMTFPMEKAGTLLVVDYPEENHSRVMELLEDLAKMGNSHQLRVLFLTRQGFEKWEDTIMTCNAAPLVEMTPVHLGKLDSEAAYRLFLSAQEMAGMALDRVYLQLSEEQLDEWLEQAPENERALFIVALAVHSALHPESEITRLTSREIIEAIVKREMAHLRNAAKENSLANEYLFEQFLAMAAIADLIPIQRIKSLISEDRLPLRTLKEVDIETTLEKAGLLKNRAMLAPKPDIIAAAFVALALGRRPEEAPEFVWTALADDVGNSLQRIARVCHDSEVVLGMHQCCLSDWLAEAVKGNPARCAAAEPFFIGHPLPLGWVKAAVAVSRSLLEIATEDDNRGRLLMNLSVHRGALGDTAGALEANKEAVEIFRRLTVAYQGRYEPALAGSLNSLSIRLTALGNAEGAMVAIEEAIKLFHRLASINPTMFEPELAGSLCNLAFYLNDFGNDAGAQIASNSAIEIYTRLCLTAPGRFEPNLAIALNNHSTYLSALGETAEALNAINKAVQVYRRLVATSPARFEPDLAMSINNLSLRLSDRGDTKGALEAIQEAVDIRRRLAGANPARFEPELAQSLTNLALPLRDLENNAAALAAIQEAVEIRNRLAIINPARFEPDLARSLGIFGMVLRQLDRKAESISAFQKGITLIRPYADKMPESPAARLLLLLESELEKT